MQTTEYKNRAELEIIACGDKHVVYSNEVTAKKIVIRVEKRVNKHCVFEGDVLDYKITIYNDSTEVIDEPIFSDDIPYGLSYVADTFFVDDKQEAPVREPFSNRISFKLKKLVPHSETIILFKVKVD